MTDDRDRVFVPRAPGQDAPAPAGLPLAGGGISGRISGTRVARQMLLDSVANWAAGAGMTVVFVLCMLGNKTASDLWMALMFGVFILLGSMSWASARAWRELPRLTLRLEQDPVGTEARITALIGRMPMQGAVRALLYHRLAVLRYRQQRFAETVDICRALLRRPLGRAAGVRPDLLLMLVDASLRRGDLGEAHRGLTDLSECALRLNDHVQYVALQTRYEVAAGYDRAALWDLDQKLRYAELLPTAPCAGLHRVLAIAARRSGRLMMADWFEARARLIDGGT